MPASICASSSSCVTVSLTNPSMWASMSKLTRKCFDVSFASLGRAEV
jgi:hypothetical protein